MIAKRLLQIAVFAFFMFICGLPIIFFGLIIGVPAIQEWHIQHTIIVDEPSQYLFDNAKQFSGSYQQRSFYYWSPKQIPEIKSFYADFIVKPFTDFDSYDAHWSIAAWENSKINDTPVSDRMSLPAELCNYHEVFECMSIAVFDTNQQSLPMTLAGIYDAAEHKVEALPKNGTLIVFSYFIWDFS